MGLPTILTKSSIRFSLSRYTQEEEIDKTVFVLKELTEKLRS
jgi:cysteine sulfinate desulfinase/cysteine desulfurase-like protein